MLHRTNISKIWLQNLFYLGAKIFRNRLESRRSPSQPFCGSPIRRLNNTLVCRAFWRKTDDISTVYLLLKKTTTLAHIHLVIRNHTAQLPSHIREYNCIEIHTYIKKYPSCKESQCTVLYLTVQNKWACLATQNKYYAVLQDLHISST